MSPEEVSAAKSFTKQLSSSKNYFITISQYLKLYDKEMLEEPLLAFDLN